MDEIERFSFYLVDGPACLDAPEAYCGNCGNLVDIQDDCFECGQPLSSDNIEISIHPDVFYNNKIPRSHGLIYRGLEYEDIFKRWEEYAELNNVYTQGYEKIYILRNLTKITEREHIGSLIEEDKLELIEMGIIKLIKSLNDRKIDEYFR